MWQIHVAGDAHAQNANNNVRLADNGVQEREREEQECCLWWALKLNVWPAFYNP
jgi:hypothetical protein